jgi:hypothetical protein
MTGPEHYQAAEKLLAPRYTADPKILVVPNPDVLATAQVHAILALAAATALAAPDLEKPTAVDQDWFDVAAGL